MYSWNKEVREFKDSNIVRIDVHELVINHLY